MSGAHLNPAVTFAFALRRNFPWSRVPYYVLAQISGGMMACGFIYYLFADAGNAGATQPMSGITNKQAFFLETLLTGGLINTILGTARGSRNVGPNGAIAVGGYIALSGLWAAPITGASMNPARSLASDLVRLNFSTTWIYLAGPLLGAIVAVMFEWLLRESPSREGAITAQGADCIKD
ncbi:MAG: aquaporin [Candidatus Omnitrophica bacterium]|nr:aquaporin [Candidatus Omnitrophota bacterium]